MLNFFYPYGLFLLIEITVTLTGDVKQRWGEVEGTYVLVPRSVNGRSYWVKTDGTHSTHAIWHDNYSYLWRIGSIGDLGSDSVSALKTDFGTSDQGLPYQINSWMYHVTYSSGTQEWFHTDDIVVESSAGMF